MKVVVLVGGVRTRTPWLWAAGAKEAVARARSLDELGECAELPVVGLRTLPTCSSFEAAAKRRLYRDHDHRCTRTLVSDSAP